MKKYCKALVNLGVAFIILALIVFLVPKLLVFFAPFVGRLDHCVDRQSPGEVFEER